MGSRMYPMAGPQMRLSHHPDIRPSEIDKKSNSANNCSAESIPMDGARCQAVGICGEISRIEPTSPCVSCKPW